MRKIIGIFIMFLTLVPVKAQSDELKTLFGFDLKNNIKNYISQEFLVENKLKYPESNENYHNVYITEKVHNKSPFYSDYWVAIDEFEVIQEIKAQKEVANLSVCLLQLDTIKQVFEDKYQYEFSPDLMNYPEFKQHRESVYTSKDNYLSLQCYKSHTNSIATSIVLFRTPKINKSIVEFYDSGL